MLNIKNLSVAVAAASIFVMPGSGLAAKSEPVTPKSALATEATSAKPAEPYIKRTPKDGVFKVVVLGDSLADGLYAGLRRLNKDNDAIAIKKKSKVNTGLVRTDRYNWNKGTKKIARSGKFQVAVVLLGLNDLQSIREKGKAHHFQQKGWVERYEKRLEAMITDLKAANLAVYWVSIPITSPKRYQKEYAYMNTFYRKAAEKHGIRYVDTWSGLQAKNGSYTPYWRDKNGKKHNIRNRDGVHFTPDGYMVFAGFLNDVLQKDISAVTNKQAAKQ